MNDETKIQSKIIKLLKMQEFIVLRIRATNEAGWPDLLALKEGRCIFMEVKTARGSPSKLQLNKISMLQLNGFTAGIVYSVAEAAHLIQSHKKNFLKSK